MKKILLLLMLLLPFTVKAEDPITLTYELCKSGCDYNDINDVYDDIESKDNTKIYDITIDIKDGETYQINSSNYSPSFGNSVNANNSSVTYKGPENNRPTIKSYNLNNLDMFYAKNLIIENINVKSNSYVNFWTYVASVNKNENSTLVIKNSDIEGTRVDIFGDETLLDNVKINGGIVTFSYSNCKYTIRNSEIFYSPAPSSELTIREQSIDIAGTALIENSSLDSKKIKLNVSTIKNSTLKSPIIEGTKKQIIKDTNIEGIVNLKGESHELDNVNIEGPLTIYNNYCGANFTVPDIEHEISIKNSKISNPNGLALKVDLNDKYKLYIDNTDLDNSSCSISASIPLILGTCLISTKPNSNLLPSYLNAQYDESSIMVSNSKINCAITEGDIGSNTRNMYFDYTNTWTKPIERTDQMGQSTLVDFSSVLEYGNVIEQDGGKIFIEFGAEDTLILNVDKEKNLQDYFKDIIPQGKVLGDWYIEDNTIVRVEDGKVIPLKVGKTAISAVIDNNVYSVFLEVKGDASNASINPNTKDIIIAAIACTITAFFLLLIAIDKYKEQKG